MIGYTCEAVGKAGHSTARVGVTGELGHIPLVDEFGVGRAVRTTSTVVYRYVFYFIFLGRGGGGGILLSMSSLLLSLSF